MVTSCSVVCVWGGELGVQFYLPETQAYLWWVMFYRTGDMGS